MSDAIATSTTTTALTANNNSSNNKWETDSVTSSASSSSSFSDDDGDSEEEKKVVPRRKKVDVDGKDSEESHIAGFSTASEKGEAEKPKDKRSAKRKSSKKKSKQQQLQLCSQSMSMPPPAPVLKKKDQVLEEETWVKSLEHIIRRDYYPDLERMKLQLELMDAEEALDNMMKAPGGILAAQAQREHVERLREQVAGVMAATTRRS